MRCQNCFKKNASIRVTQILNDQEKELILCESCAETLGIKQAVSNLPQIFTGVILDILKFKKEESGLPVRHSESGRCPSCGYPWKEFKRTGLLGCDNCFSTYYEQIKVVLNEVQGSTKHIGQYPKSGESAYLEHHLSFLEQALQDAISKEDYESAAAFRDKIRTLKQNSKKN